MRNAILKTNDYSKFKIQIVLKMIKLYHILHEFSNNIITTKLKTSYINSGCTVQSVIKSG